MEATNQFKTVQFGYLRRDLRLYKINDTTQIGYVDMLSDNELLDDCASALAKQIYFATMDSHNNLTLFTAANKGTPLAHVVATKLRLMGCKVEVVIARKENKLFYGATRSITKRSITSADVDTLFLTEYDISKIVDHTVCIIDDVYTTGASMQALNGLAEICGHAVNKDHWFAALCELDDGEEPPENLHYVFKLPMFHEKI